MYNMAATLFEIKIENLSQLTKALRNYPAIAAPVLQRAIEGTGFVFQKNTLKNDPVPWRTGNLLQSFRFRSSPGEARWSPTANYASFVEFGTRPHVIMPRRRKMLRWTVGSTTGRYVTSRSGRQRYQGGQSGSYVFAQRVNHPGTRAQPFMGKIVERSNPEVTRLFGQAGDIIMREIANISGG